MNEYRVTKYNPAFRNQSGAYIKDEQTSFKDIGRTISGVLLTTEEYEWVEEAYASAALGFLREGGVSAIRVAGLENSQKRGLDFQNDSVLPLNRLDDIIRRILREEFWCRLESSEGFVHLGWDYYMYIGVPHPCPTAQERAAELGLYVEEFESPYGKEAANSRQISQAVPMGRRNTSSKSITGVSTAKVVRRALIQT